MSEEDDYEEAQEKVAKRKNEDTVKDEEMGSPFFKASDMQGDGLDTSILSQSKVELTDMRTGEVREARVIGIQYKGEEVQIVLNKTNLQRLVKKHGKIPSKWIGKEITFVKVRVTNPQTKQEVDSLRILDK